jgi:hypothetical protein
MNYNSMVNLLVVAPLDNDHRSYSGELLRDDELWPSHKIEPETPV